jgi:hypothetical protein
MDLEKELIKLCKGLNNGNIKYVLVGGCAVILHGYYRTTHDIDLILEPSISNMRNLKNVLYDIYKTRDILQINDDEIQKYTVIRFAPESEEIVIDLMAKIGDVDYITACRDIEELEIEGVKIPLCGLDTLIKTKQGLRPKDKEDLLFLLGKKEYLAQNNIL